MGLERVGTEERGCTLVVLRGVLLACRDVPRVLVGVGTQREVRDARAGHRVEDALAQAATSHRGQLPRNPEHGDGAETEQLNGQYLRHDRRLLDARHQHDGFRQLSLALRPGRRLINAGDAEDRAERRRCEASAMSASASVMFAAVRPSLIPRLGFGTLSTALPAANESPSAAGQVRAPPAPVVTIGEVHPGVPVLDRSGDLLGRLTEEMLGDLELLATVLLHLGDVADAVRGRWPKLNIA